MANTVLSAIAADRMQAVPQLAGYLAGRPGGPVPVWGYRSGHTAEDAAFANAALAHGLSFDDTMDVLLGHPGPCLTAAIFAAGHGREVNGARLVSAFSAGLDVMVGLAESMNPDHYVSGFHATSTLGTIGAAAAAASVCGIDSRAAVLVATSLAAGLRVNVGSELRPAHAGWAARAGVEATDLVAAGFRADPEALDGPLGFRSVFSRGSRHPAEVGEPVLNGPVLNLKEFPCCGAAAPAIRGILQLKPRLGGRPERVRLRVSSLVPEVLRFHEPTDGEQGRFSLEYCAAAALLFDEVGPQAFAPAAVRAVSESGLMRSVEYEVADLGGTKYETEISLISGTRDVSGRYAGVGGLPVDEYDAEALRRRWSSSIADDAPIDRVLTAFDESFLRRSLAEVEQLICSSRSSGGSR